MEFTATAIKGIEHPTESHQTAGSEMGMRLQKLIIAGIFLISYTNIHAQNAISVQDMKLSYCNSLDWRNGDSISGKCINPCCDSIRFNQDSNKSIGFVETLSENGESNENAQIRSSCIYVLIPSDEKSKYFLFSLRDIFTLTSKTGQGGSEGSCKRVFSFVIKTPKKGLMKLYFENMELEGTTPKENNIRIVVNGKDSIYQRGQGKELIFGLKKGNNTVYIDFYNGAAMRNNIGRKDSEELLLASDLQFYIKHN